VIEVKVRFHNDGDSLLITNTPMLIVVCEWLIAKSRLEVISYRLWNNLLIFTHKFQKELYIIPIEHGCVATQALWGNTCWRKDCPIHERSNETNGSSVLDAT
jgi:hypothetical protein